MWARLRLDLGWTDLLKGAGFCFNSFSSDPPQIQLETEWSSGKNDALACLSLRSAFDLLLTAMNWPAGSEILFSALTIPDMPEIAVQHQLIPVPVPVLLPDFHVDLNALKKRINEQTRAIVVAQLFGNRVDLSELRSMIGSQDILIIEDCAQAWFQPEWRGSPAANVSLFSFGMIKTATALGGGLARVGNPSLLSEMRTLQDAFPTQSRWAYLKKLAKAGLLKLLTYRIPLGLAIRLAQMVRVDLVTVFSRMTRGFQQGELLHQLRQQPCGALLRMIRHRLHAYPESRISQRITNAEQIRNALEDDEKLCPVTKGETSFWLFPVFIEHAESLIAKLRQHGFDATQRGSLQPVRASASDHQQASDSVNDLLNRMVFLPCYAEMGAHEIDRMCRVVKQHSSKQKRPERGDFPAVSN
ncbi:MAG TPA: DegT/DnrJ/EryC1/StrS family aminotransferase [Planctomicrobium sp.]|nr:DegT/DnrJ/EryC1/StrS family aminotransferase [Planctomicrobium sp.]